jgi:hypothetical protein
MKLRDFNPFAPLPDVATLQAEELDELQRALYLEDKRADHHLANVCALRQRIAKLESLGGGT